MSSFLFEAVLSMGGLDRDMWILGGNERIVRAPSNHYFSELYHLCWVNLLLNDVAFFPQLLVIDVDASRSDDLFLKLHDSFDRVTRFHNLIFLRLCLIHIAHGSVTTMPTLRDSTPPSHFYFEQLRMPCQLSLPRSTSQRTIC